MGERTKTEMVYRLIRSRITKGALKPGEKLNISELAAQSGVSTIPVREAIKQLQSEGLVEIDSYKGIHVVSYTMQEMRELYQIRAELEGLAARMAAEKNGSAIEKRLEKILDDRNKSVTKKNYDFHKLIYLHADSERLYNMIDNLWNAMYIVNNGVALQHVEGQKDKSAVEHRAIVKAIGAEDGELADKLIHQHILSAGERTILWIGKE